MSFDGYLLINKPVGWSSFDVVAKVRGILSNEYLKSTGEKKKIKVGHTGTLDPLATGLMIVVVGSYCKRAEEFSKLDKTYKVEMKLGQKSSTGDEEGEKSFVSEEIPSESAVKNAVESFVGEIMQIPPSFSAIKINGQRAYKLAREGKSVEIEPRKVTIHKISDLIYDYPTVSFNCSVSSGTYIRSLVQDIGDSLSVGAYMSSLNRTKVGKHDIKQAVSVDHVNFGELFT